MSRRRLLVPEVVQTSAMDCGPAALKALLEGFGVSASYGRLREACQTDVDGTSVNDLEATAVRLGLAAEQIMVPVDHVTLRSARALPALCVVTLPNGLTHFVIGWARHGRWIQVMDPATGRRWQAAAAFAGELYRHTQRVDAAAWRTWAGTEDFRLVLHERMRRLGVRRALRQRLDGAACADRGWEGIARLDAAVRMAAHLAGAGGIRPGAAAGNLIARGAAGDAPVPPRYWSVRPVASDATRLAFRGAVLLRVRGRRPQTKRTEALPPELAAALRERPPRPARTLVRMMWQDGAFAPAVIVAGAAVAAGGVVLEAVLWRGFLDIGRELSLAGQRVGGLLAMTAVLAALFLLEWPIGAQTLRLSRHLEQRFRQAFLHRIPRLRDRYFQSRLVSDMAERSHSVHYLRQVPEAGYRFLRAALEMAAVVGGIWWLYPDAAGLAAAVALAALAVPLAAQRSLAEQDMRMRSRLGGMSRFYLDALLGGMVVRAHGAAGAMRQEFGDLLREWARAGMAFQRAVARTEVAQMIVALAGAAWLLQRHAVGPTGPVGLLLLAYWTLSLPVLGQEAAAAAWQYPRLRNIAVRLAEPLGAVVDPDAKTPASATAGVGAAVSIRGVTARAGGHVVLADIDVEIAAGEHVAIVGESGAGKSSLVGLLLGWLEPAAGRLRVDGRPLDRASLMRLRTQTAWVDPTVQLWNRSLLDNLAYGLDGAPPDLSDVLDDASLHECVHRLPEGLRTTVGEGGTLLSGGEGQRVRVGRGLLRAAARLVILDEPGRGLDREHRRRVVRRCRARWPSATLLGVTHDIEQALEFPRVLVVHGGRIVEDGPPDLLAARPDGRFHALLDAARAAGARIWAPASWRRVTVRAGGVHQGHGPPG